MDLKGNILRTENEFPKIFTSYIEKDYGILFYNDSNKKSYDSNHAILYTEKISDIEFVLRDIKEFYLSKGIIPRIYQPFITGYFRNYRDLLDKLGFQVEEYGVNRFMLLSGENNICIKKPLEIKRLFEWDVRIANEIFIPNGEEYEIDVAKSYILNKNKHLFVGYLNDIAVTTTYFHISDYGCTRFDYIDTAKNHRGKGYAREVLSYVVDYCKENNIFNCYQWPAHETSEKMCFEAGFRLMFQIEVGSAVYYLSE
jgi:GNAT superfamily N-acetyltransferase